MARQLSTPLMLLYGLALPLLVLAAGVSGVLISPGWGLALGLIAGLFTHFGARRLVSLVKLTKAESHDLGEQLVHVQKLAVLGEMAAGVAHEINNPMMIIGQEAEIIGLLVDRSELAGTPQAEEIKDSVEQIKQQVSRCGGITHGMLQAARKRDAVDQPVDINKLVEDMAVLVEQETAMADVSIVRLYCKRLPSVITDGPMLRQVILNLLSNAAQAVKGGGKIFITTGLRDGMVLIEVRDTGPGIAPEHMEKLFSPFFTTKAPGQGTGLGLSISLRIINELGGSITVESELGDGAAFTVHLPRERVRAAGQALGRAWARRMLGS